MLHPKNSTRAVTLIELLVVTALISMILGVSSAFFTQFNKRLALTSATLESSSIIRRAKNFSLETKRYSTVEIDTKNHKITAWGSRIVRFWHLEDTISTGAFDKNLEVYGAKLVSGKIGQGLVLKNGSKLDAGVFLDFAIRGGFAISMWVSPGQFSSQQVLWKIGDHYSFGLKSNYTLYFKGDKEIKSNFYPPPYQWTHLRVIVDGININIYANDLLVASEKLGDKAEIQEDAHLLIGTAFLGKIDEIGLEMLIDLESYQLPEKVYFTKDNLKYIRFANGYLDPLRHIMPISLNLTSETTTGKQIAGVDISLMGKVATRESRNVNED